MVAEEERGSGAGEGHPDPDPDPHPNHTPTISPAKELRAAQPAGVEWKWGGGSGGKDQLPGKLRVRSGAADHLRVGGRPTLAELCLPASHHAASASLA